MIGFLSRKNNTPCVAYSNIALVLVCVLCILPYSSVSSWGQSPEGSISSLKEEINALKQTIRVLEQKVDALSDKTSRKSIDIPSDLEAHSKESPSGGQARLTVPSKTRQNTDAKASHKYNPLTDISNRSSNAERIDLASIPGIMDTEFVLVASKDTDINKISLDELRSLLLGHYLRSPSGTRLFAKLPDSETPEMKFILSLVGAKNELSYKRRLYFDYTSQRIAYIPRKTDSINDLMNSVERNPHLLAIVSKNRLGLDRLAKIKIVSVAD